MTIPDAGPAPVTSDMIRKVVESYTGSTTGADRDRLQNTKRMARWSQRLATYMLRIADEMDRLHRLLEEQGRIINDLRSPARPGVPTAPPVTPSQVGTTRAEKQ